LRKVELAGHLQRMREQDICRNQHTIKQTVMDDYTQNCYWVARFGGRRLNITKGLLKLEGTIAGSGAWRA
jgi:hypothetical protein